MARPVIATVVVLATAGFLAIAAVAASSAAAADSYFSYEFGYSSYGPSHKYRHSGHPYHHHYGRYYGFPYRYGRHHGFPFGYYGHYRHRRHSGIYLVYRHSTYVRSPVRAAAQPRLKVVRVVGAPDPSLSVGHGNRARIDCKPTTGTSRVNGREALFGGTFCYDTLGRGYIVPGSQHFIGYTD